LNTAFPFCDQQHTITMRETAAMRTFAFKTTIDVVVRVQAADVDSALVGQASDLDLAERR
jgi:hypothetical protein